LFNAFDTSIKALTQIRDQLLSCAGGAFDKRFPIAHPVLDRDLYYSGSIPTAINILIPDPTDCVIPLGCIVPLISKVVGSGISSGCERWDMKALVLQPEVVPIN
jgi:hypothetical protein